MHPIITSLLLAAAITPAAAATDADDIAGYVYPANRPESVELHFMPDGLSYLDISPDGKTITAHDVRTGKVTSTVLDVNTTRESRIDAIEGFSLSPDGSKLLVYAESTAIYRNSTEAAYYVYEIRRNTLKPLSTEHPRQQQPLFSPDSRMVAFMAEDNNIYLKKLDYGTETAVTTDGAINAVRNGVADWTYEEEFATLCSMAWAPDNATLCYLKYDETDVPAYSFALYEGTCNPHKEYALYPGQYSYKYPVAGEPNSKVTLWSYDVDNRKTKSIALPDKRIEYIPRIAYGPTAEQLLVTTLNRDQNRMELYMVNPKSTVARSILVEESDAWISPLCYERLTLEPDGFVMFSERDGYSHLYRYSFTGSLLGQLTSGNYDVTDYYGMAPDGSRYYQSAETGPLNRTVVKLDRKGRTTRLTPDRGWASADFSPARNFFTVNYSTATQPPVYTLYETGSGKKVKVLEDNAAYAAKYAGTPTKEFFTMTSDGHELNGFIIKPANFSPDKKYPVIMSQYSGPGSQEVTERWRMDWDTYFAIRGYVVICVDGRGTGGRGTEFRNVVYKRLGHYETIDQLAAARHAASLPFVDAGRIGIFGWSYGGYETLMAATAPGSPYAAAVAVAPVTSWRYYDTVYTERYMTTPRQNPDGYDAGAPINRVNNLKCRLLIMSGTADDNVHLSNTMEFVARLQAAGGLCDMLLFPNMNHSINGCNARALVYAKMLDYFNRNM